MDARSRECLTRGVCVAALMVAVASCHGQTKPAGQIALDRAIAVAKERPIEEGVAAYESVITQFRGTQYAEEAFLRTGALYNGARRFDEGLQVAETFLASYGDSPRAGQAVRVKCTALLNRNARDPQQVLDFLADAVQNYAGRFTPTDLKWLPVYRAEAYRQLNDSKKAAEAFREGLIESPQLLDLYDGRYLLMYAQNLATAGDATAAVAAAKGAYACCKFGEAAIKEAASTVVRALTASGAVFGASQFLETQEDPAKPSPLADSPWPELTDDEKRTILERCGEDGHLQIVVLLYLGDYEEAFALATARLAAAEETSEIAASIDEIARCFKAKDLNLVRANAFIRYAKEGEGTNPLPDF